MATRIFLTLALLLFVAGCPGPPAGPACGDGDGDGVITTEDAVVALQAAIGLGVCDLCVCDVDGNGRITAADARLIAEGGPLACPPC